MRGCHTAKQLWSQEGHATHTKHCNLSQHSLARELARAPVSLALRAHRARVPALDAPDSSDAVQGLASTYLTACKQGDRIHCSIATAPSFHLPMDPSCPAIFVAAGTGIAPFRSFWMERAARGKYTGGLAPAVLFFGCRSKAADCLFSDVRRLARVSHTALRSVPVCAS